MSFEHCGHILHELLLPLFISVPICYVAFELSGGLVYPLLEPQEKLIAIVPTRDGDSK